MPGKRARRHFSQLSEFERGLIIGMKTAGWSTCRVAGQVDRSECAVRNCWEQWTREGTHARKTGSGATRKTTRREDRRIVRQALVDPTVTRSTIRADVGVAIVPQTISRYLAKANLKSKRPFRALPLTPEHRLQWCQARSMWNVTDWQKVVFSDESRFVLGTDDNRVRVWRRPAYDSRSTLIVMLGTLTGQRYVDDIIRPHVEPFLNGLPGAIFQQDNARPHTAKVAQDFLRHFQTLPWPSRSPDLSPIEHLCALARNEIPVHMDGARIINASIHCGVPVHEIVKECASVSMCLSKGIGAPVGSVVAGSKEFIERALRCRKVLGGAMRQVGVLAAAALVALETAEERLRVDHQRAKKFAQEIHNLKSKLITADPGVIESNMVLLNFPSPSFTSEDFVARMAEVKKEDEVEVVVKACAWFKNRVRCVLHSDLTQEDLDYAVKKIRSVAL
ncbi:probable low-specificity L-threonine aldolase 1 [Trichonephila clavipes]|nr:probable low-specificity L-threonine aldolase 1 [Trichonephila clavipes]